MYIRLLFDLLPLPVLLARAHAALLLDHLAILVLFTALTHSYLYMAIFSIKTSRLAFSSSSKLLERSSTDFDFEN